MASLKEIKGRIASIQSTQKITSAMRMAASAKLHRTQGMTEKFLRYKDGLCSILESLGYSNETQNSCNNDNVMLIPISSSSGLCGAFNSNIAKATFYRLNELKANGNNVITAPIGKKIAHELQKNNTNFIADYIHIIENIEKDYSYNQVAQIVTNAIHLHEEGKISHIEFIFHHFHSMGSQVITRKVISLDIQSHSMPMADEETVNTNETQENDKEDKYLTEPSATELITSIFPRLLNAEVYGMMLDSLTSEHASRMLAMQTADDNANELLRELTLLYNKTRQQAITNELIDIMGGKVGEQM